MLFFTMTIALKLKEKSLEKYNEAINHKKALELVFKNLQNDDGFDERFIKKLNETINRDIKDTEDYRTVQVFIQGSEHIPPEPEKVPNLMMYYIYNYNHAEQDIYKIYLLKLLDIILNLKEYILLRMEMEEQVDYL